MSKKFLVKTVLFCVLIGGSLAAFYAACEMDFTDRFYHKFTQPAGSMVIGSSRALLGLDPDVLDSVCSSAQTPFLNFAFTQRTSPYGEVYYNAISKKLDGEGGNGVFILEVSPLSISSAGEKLPERELVLNEMVFFNLDPNFEYVLRNSEHPLYFDMLSWKHADVIQRSHTSGWLENLVEPDPEKKEAKIVAQTKEYEDLFRSHRVSAYRMQWLEATVVLLKKHGKVVLLRMPVDSTMKQMEAAYCPDFNARITALAARTGVSYLNTYDSTGYEFADLHHMTSESAGRYSAMVAGKIAARP